MDLLHVFQYIKTKYPNSSLAINYEGIDDPGVELMAEACMDFFFGFNKLNWCGCGHPHTAYVAVSKLLYWYQDTRKLDNRLQILADSFNIEDCNNGLLLCLMYILDAAGFTEHGSSIYGAWLTDEGKMLFLVLQEHKRLFPEEY